VELILIRHGLPDHKETNDGRPADPSLSEIGLGQADKMAGWLKTHPIDHLYSSPMKRALETAHPLSRIKGLDVQIEDGVAEYDRHADHYVPVEKLKELDYDRWKQLMNGTMGSKFPGFADEVCSSLNRIVNENRGKRVAVTCHGGVINVWACHVLGMSPRMFFNPNYTSINRFMVASSGEKSIITLNEHTHIL
jgi:probable phosphoglycerate mutase